MARRLIDIGLSVAVLLLTAVPLLGVALAILIFDGKPFLFSQRRVGRNGRVFRLHKFRTMKAYNRGGLVTTEGDSRITPIGGVLRDWKIDEVPQFWNVLRGDMSLIGPRPEAERLVRHYTHDQRQLLAYTPGLASMSQLVYPHEPKLLNGHPNPEEVYVRQLMPKKIAIDLQYEQNRTLRSDLGLVAELLLFIVSGRSRRVDRSLFPKPTGQEGIVT
jgi:lipopolysaccharide/colanic/teichoic acid biosynthesis glycosyltransferase